MRSHWDPKFLVKWQECSPSHLLGFFCRVLGETEGKNSQVWVKELARRNPSPVRISNSLCAFCVWEWEALGPVTRRRKTPSTQTLSFSFQTGMGPTGFREEVLGLSYTGGRTWARDSSENPRHRRNRRNWLQLVKMPGICTLLCDLKQK